MISLKVEQQPNVFRGLSESKYGKFVDAGIRNGIGLGL